MNQLENPFVIVLAILFLFLQGCQKRQDKELTRTLEYALESFELEEGFQIELIAGEPLISDPVDMEIDEFGRLYVVEMHGYPLDLSGSGKIKLLSDTNGDGKMDQSITFAEGLMLPTGILRWKQGVLVTDPPNVYYLEDSDGDGKADIKEIVLTGFALSNPQHNVNSPRLGLDNWIYLGHEPAVTTNLFEEEFGDRGSEIFFPSKPLGGRLPQNAGGRSIRFRPDSHQLEVLASRTQFGHTFDAWGHRFVINNNNHIIHDIMAAKYLNRNPYLVLPQTTVSISDHGNAAEVFPITINPEHQLLTDVGVMTSACGITAYLGAAFPLEYEGAVFVAEPVSNLVHIDFLSDKGSTFVASRQHHDKEFLASTDSWFRPVNMYIGPDGALYVVDYYRQIIEHPEWMAEEVVKSGALYNGTDKGRIYRISPKGKKPLDWSNKVNLTDLSVKQLVEKLSDPNIWWRRNAQRLLLDRFNGDVPENLIDQAKNMDSPLGRIHSLWALEGMGKMDSELLKMAFLDPSPGVRLNAIKIAELHLSNFFDLGNALVKLKSDPDPKVRYQLLCTLGFVEGPSAREARKDLLFQDIQDEWFQIAALTAPYEESRQLMNSVVASYQNENPAYASLLQKLSAMIGASLDQKTVLDLIRQGTSNNLGLGKNWQAPLLIGLAQGIQSKKVSDKLFSSTEDLLLQACFENPSIEVRQASLQFLKVIGLPDNKPSKGLMEKSLSKAQNRSLSQEERILGINFLTLHNPKPFEGALKGLIQPMEPLPVQLAAMKAISSIPDESPALFVLNAWNTLSPEVREEGLNTLMANNQRMKLLLDGLESGIIQPTQLGWPRSVRLMNHYDLDLKSRARMLINSTEGREEEILQKYKGALELKGSFSAGKVVYDQNCAVCHKMGLELGQVFGPDLATLKNRSEENILRDILLPNLSIADGYDLWSVELQNGENLQGLIASETPTAIMLRNAGGQERSIARQDIRSLKVMEISAMPLGLESNINPQEMADLLAFILRKNQ
jgi:putative membrane-bound dehydrogenase-like protein